MPQEEYQRLQREKRKENEQVVPDRMPVEGVTKKKKLGKKERLRARALLSAESPPVAATPPP